MSRWTLYTAPGTCALATHIALCEAGADFDVVKLDFGAGQQRSPEYLRINPAGRVPALVTEHGVLTETPALLAFIAQRFPAARLAPEGDAFAFARMQSFNVFLTSTVHVAHAHKRRGARWTDDEAAIAALTAYVPTSMTGCAQQLEAMTAATAGPWALGEHYSVTDGYLYTLGGWLEADGVDMARFPRLVEHRQRVGERPAVRQALEQAR